MQNQLISVLSSEDATEPLVVLSDENRQLGFYGLRDWQVLKVSIHSCLLDICADLAVIGG